MRKWDSVRACPQHTNQRRENPYGWSCPATNPFSWTSRTAHASSFGSVFPSSLGAALGQMFDGWKKYGSTRSHPTFLQFQLSKKTHQIIRLHQSSKFKKFFNFRGVSIKLPWSSKKTPVLPRCNENCLRGRLKIGDPNSSSHFGESNAEPMGAPFFGHLFWENPQRIV